MSDDTYNGEQLAIDAADNLWSAIQALNLTDMDPAYRPSAVRLASDSDGSPFRQTRDALLSLLTVIVSADPWITPRADVAASVWEALCESGETVRYHIGRLRRDCLNKPAVEIDLVGDGYAHVYLRGHLGEDGASRKIIHGTREFRPTDTDTPTGRMSAGGEDGIPSFDGSTWRTVATRLARHYRLSGAIVIDDETGDNGGSCKFTVAFGG